MKRHRPNPDQSLFVWCWHDPTDDRLDTPEDEMDEAECEAPPPLRERVQGRHATAGVVELWGNPVLVRKSPRRPAAAH